MKWEEYVQMQREARDREREKEGREKEKRTKGKMETSFCQWGGEDGLREGKRVICMYTCKFPMTSVSDIYDKCAVIKKTVKNSGMALTCGQLRQEDQCASEPAWATK